MRNARIIVIEGVLETVANANTVDIRIEMDICFSGTATSEINSSRCFDKELFHTLRAMEC
ncbi:hypothetical protein Psal159_01750 [Piscirickettsia salmonis]|nr:outer membrane insertion C-terminal signal domain protein [Piscirickettsia salmonis]QGO80738.1 hypothetical protein Psal107_01751 [Piscirickettsia salmonis]QGP22610.1 hypothetical protein Psal158_01748 [Piscirickettsia salmonis]QGP25995.1 hypothetical protein Psal159_01750 [Piscirickettsia salmonis]QGP29383.1 hypothetical protein Psal160_01755 [Piscirickettsia salmonis]